MPASYPNRRCTCGFSRFREERSKVSSSVERWAAFLTPGGLGSVPMGAGLGASGVSWGLFTSTIRAAQKRTACESCGRVRSSSVLGGIAVFGSYALDGFLYVVASDVHLPASCFSVRFDGAGGSFTVPLDYRMGSAPLPFAAAPPVVTAPTPPPGAELADALLAAPLPEVDISDTYTVTFIDACADEETPLDPVFLEAEPMIFQPTDADLLGAPIQWMSGPGGVSLTNQPAVGARLSIPFDKCKAVIEYDAWQGTDPAAQGFTHLGTGLASDYSMVDGGVLSVSTKIGLPSYWFKTVALTASPKSAFIYTRLLHLQGVYTVPGSGLGFLAEYATSVGGAYAGAHMVHSDLSWRATKLNASADHQYASHAAGWTAGAGAKIELPGSLEQVWIDGQSSTSPGTSLFGTEGIAPAFECKVAFGDEQGTPCSGYIRNVVGSFGGRFIRAMFAGFAQTSTPMLRLYLMSDSTASLTRTARFRVKYGPATANPFLLPASTAEITVNFSATNSVYEVPIQLTGLTPRAPMWFTVERVWDHVEDLLDATVHFFQGTLRST